MDKPAFKLVILFDIDQGQVSGEFLQDLAMIMSQYGLKPATLNVSNNDDNQSSWQLNAHVEREAPAQPTMEKDEKTHEARVLRFPVERTRPKRDDSDPV